MKLSTLLLLLFGLVGFSVTHSVASDPLLTSWYTTNSAQYARVYETKAKRTSGTSSTTWTNQVLPSYSDIQRISYSSSWVYVQYSGLSSYVMGPWLNPQGGVFQFWPTNQHAIRRFPRTPVVQSGTKDATSGGYSGLYVNGVAVFNALDGQAWDGTQIQGNAAHTQSTYYWHRNAPVAESFNFDYALGHQPPTAIYHTHQNPIGLRYQLGDHVDYDSSTKNYSESTDTPTKHSPIIGWAHDGYPIYGPYGYSTATDANSGIRRMVAGYVKRDGSNGTDSVDSNRSTIPAWYARFRQNHFGGGYSTTAGVSRPAVNSTYTLGTFAEDWSYLGDLTNPTDSQVYQQGVDFDLDEYNGRYCVTPEFPSGTYAYFVAIDSTGASTYPYVFGYEFYGDATGGSVSTISESVTTNFVGGPYTSVDITSTEVNSGDDTVTLVWNSVEGGTYQVEKSDDGNSWTTAVASVSATPGTTTQSSFTGNGGTGYTRVTRTALASYDSVITGSYSTTQTDSTSYTTPLPVIYVNAARAGQPTQDGQSWATAYAYLQDAMYDAQPGDEIWVAAGVYYPDEAVNSAVEAVDNDRASSFELDPQVEIYGGFNGTETARSQRDPSANLTVLSGDLDKNDTTVNGVVVTDPKTNTTGNNAYHVVTLVEADSTVVLDGFTITAGRADGSGTQSQGAGIYAQYANPTISQCVVQGNYAASVGAGIYSSSTSDDITLTKVDVLANASDEGAAGIYLDSAHLFLDSCRIQGNTSLPDNYYGTANAIHIIEGSLTMSNCLVSGNYGKLNDNILVDSEGSSLSLTIYNSTITGNYSDTNDAQYAGGVNAIGSVNFKIYNSIIWGNVSDGGSDNVYNLDAQYYSLIEGNNPGNNGNLDGTDANNAPLFLTGVTASTTATTSGDFRLYGNSPGIDVGDNISASDLTGDLAGNARVVNTTVDLGAYEYDGPSVTSAVANQSIESSAGATTVADLDNVFSGSSLSFSASASGNSGIFDVSIETGNVLTVTPTGTAGGTGTVTVTATDGSGNKYTITFTVTVSYKAIWYVNAARSGKGTQTGTSWATAFADLQDALASASSGDEIWVAAGVYYPDEAEAGIASVVNNSTLSNFQLKESVSVYGGFAGTESARSERDSSANLTVLSGDVDHDNGGADNTVNGVIVSDPVSNIVGSNANTVVEGSFRTGTILDGFTITGAATQGIEGGAYYRRCVIQGNMHAIYHEDDTTIYVECDFLSNYAASGSVLTVGGTDVEFVSCRIMGNEAAGTSTADVVVSIGSATAHMVNCLITGNKGNGNGAIQVVAISGVDTPLYIDNCTIAGNLQTGTGSSENAGGLAAQSGARVELSNTIIWGNTGTVNNNYAGNISPNFSLVEGYTPDESGLDGNNSANDPLFLNQIAAASAPTTSGDYRVYGQSPVIGQAMDVNNPNDTYDLDGDGNTSEKIPYDLAGNARIIGTQDMGAYEYDGPTVSTTISSQTVNSSGGATTVADLDNVFSGSGLTFGISASGNSGLFDATIATGNVVTITPQGGTGSGSVTVTATDSSGNQYALSFTVAIEATPEPAYSQTQIVNSWLTNYTGRYARIYETYADEQAGNAVTTWDNGTYAQSTPVYGGVQKVQYSTDYVYILTTGLASGHVMGPWYNDTGAGGSLEVFRNWPEAIYTTYRIPTQPVIPTTKTTYPGGAIGVMVDGTLIYSESDSYSWDNAGDGSGNGSDTGPTVINGGLGDGLWLHDAYLTEGNTFDKSNAHAAGNQLHYHASPMKLRHLVGDSVDAVLQVDGSYVYTENFNGKHSPILGWMNDGIPLYGPYGYSDAMDPNSGVRRMVSGFIVRNGANGSYDTAANGRTKLPAWSARYRNRSATLSVNEQGPTTATLDVPYFMEDYDYLGDLTNPADGQPYEQGVDFDLNEYNARFCVTPEFPNGTWAYFVSVGADGKPAFPYNVGAQYYGDPSRGGSVTSIDESVTTTFVGGPDAQIKINTPTADDGTVTLTWSAVEGGTYTVQGKTDVTAASWSTVASGVKPTLDVGQSSDNSGGSQRFYQIVRTALDAYDATGKSANLSGGSGGSGGTGGTGGTGGAPTISQVSPNSTTEGSTVTVSITLSGDNLPPSDAVPTSVTIGTVSGASITYNGSVVTASFTFPSGTTGAKDVSVTFPPPQSGDALVVTATSGFTINAMSGGSGGSAPTISQVSPNSATEGATVSVSITLSGDMLPPSDAVPTSVTIGTVSGTSITYNGSVVTASFTFPSGTTGAKDVSVTFPPPQSGDALVVTATSGFTINAMSGGGGGGVVTFNATFPTDPPLPPQNAIEAAAVGSVSATITSYDQNSGAVTLQFNNTSLSAGSYSATLKFTPPSDTQHTVTSSNQYTRN